MVIEYCRPTGGTGHVASDEHVWHLQKRLAREEGIFCEPAGAVALAGALQAAREGLVQAEQTIVCLVTGSGFKDQASLSRMVSDADCPLIDLAEMDGIFRNA